MTSATAIICYLPPSLSHSVPLQLSRTVVSSHIVLIFLSTVFWLAFSIGYSQKRDFANITVIIRGLVPGTDYACSTL